MLCLAEHPGKDKGPQPCGATCCSMDSVEFMLLLWLTHLPALGCVKSRKSAGLFSPAMNASGQRTNPLSREGAGGAVVRMHLSQ
jgi:hypothetical protein